MSRKLDDDKKDEEKKGYTVRFDKVLEMEFTKIQMKSGISNGADVIRFIIHQYYQEHEEELNLYYNEHIQ